VNYVYILEQTELCLHSRCTALAVFQMVLSVPLITHVKTAVPYILTHFDFQD